MKKRGHGAILIVIILAAACFFIYRSLTILTYLEYHSPVEDADGYIVLSKSGESLMQDFRTPYNLLNGVSIKIGTFGRDNNSAWRVSIIEKDTGSLLRSKVFNASLIQDNAYHLFQFNTVRVDPQKTYQLRIEAEDVNEMTRLAFYRQSGASGEGLSLRVNNSPDDGMLCVAIYGGDTDYWWAGFIVIMALLLIAMVLRWQKAAPSGLTDDSLFMGLAIMVAVILLIGSFAVQGVFTDENDNIRGGMIIAKGGVLYRDYVTQHTPVVYYLCGLFAACGASSVAQFRLSYYIFVGAVWGLLYIRHSRHFGKWRMLALPIAESVLIASINQRYSTLILSDGFQGLCTVALLLEFIRYLSDGRIDWGRSAVVTLCIWGSIGAAFVSVFAVVWVGLGVVLNEFALYTGKEKGKMNVKTFIFRYGKLIVMLALPPLCAIAYFSLNHCLDRAWKMIYRFNTEVYSRYIGGLGSNLFQPFLNAIQNYAGMITDNVNFIINAQSTGEIWIQLSAIVLATIAIISLAVKKRCMEAVVLFMTMCCSATRNGFHLLPLWYVAIMISVVLADAFRDVFTKNLKIPVLGILLILMTGTFVRSVGNNLLYRQGSVSAQESEIVKRTDEGERIYIEGTACDSIYLLHRNRYPVNRAVYMLPWYMDWYEQDAIDDLNEHKPDIVVFNENSNVWGYTYYSNAFLNALKSDYTRLSEDPAEWRYVIWCRNT